IKGGEKRLFVRGEKHYLGEDGKYHLENNIEIKIFPKKKGEEETIIRAQNATYNQEKTLFILTSNVAIKRGGLTLETQEILFNRKRDVIRAKGEIQFFTDKLKGEGKGLIYFPEDKIIKILANVKGEIERKNEKYPINFQCNRLEYKKEEKKIFLRGKVRIYQHYNGLKANQALLMLSPSEKELKSIKLIKNAKVTLVSEDKKTDELKEIREMKADEILVNFKNEDINFIRGRENCKLKIISEKSVSKEIKAYEIELFINEDQTANFKAIGNVYLKDFEQDREIIGEIVIKDNESFTVFGKGGQNASLSFENNRLSAQKILIKPEENTILAKGKIENIIHPDSAEKSSISFLSPNKNIKISSGEMSYDDGKKSLVFRNNVQLKQGNSLITCEKINFDKKKRIILASGKLRAFLYLEKEKGIITILSEEMEFNDLNR
ncbi:LPS export ABC transporter periplasmic protein LptC, partial [SCandidatus Aminicenantes bacterium Aminicenantia_JdfR_composite]|nr:LPS export ABC transporter periplasmic protein LptC [SCandidatus Aminicenantes bacterium Aminicenantia_JdfR_composite]